MHKLFLTAAKSLLPGRRAVRLIREGNKANAARLWGEAATSYAKALEIVPERAAIWVQYGHSLKEQGFLRDAEAAYFRALTLEETADTHLQLGHVLKLQGEVAPAISAYEAALRLAPEMVYGRAELASLRAGAPGLLVVPNSHLRRKTAAGQKKETDPTGTVAAKSDFPSGTHAAFLVPTAVPTSLDELLTECRIEEHFVSRFDALYYFNANAAVRNALRIPDRGACLIHFCRIGIDLSLPLSADDAFDSGFYVETQLKGMPFTAGNAYRHWLNVGLPSGAAANRRQWLRARLGEGVLDLDSVDLALFAAQENAEASQLPWTGLVEDFIEAVGGVSRILVPTIENAGLLHAAAERLELDEVHRARAFRLRQIVWASVPMHRPNRMRYAQGLLDRGTWVEAAAIYRTETEQEDAPAMAFLRLSECQERLGMFEAALRTSARARAMFPGDQFLRNRHPAVIRQFFEQQWKLALAAGRLGRLSDGQDIVRKACLTIQELSPHGVEHPHRVIASVALVGHYPLPQCRMYRIDAKADELEAAGYTVEVFDLGGGADAFKAAAHRFEAAIFFRVPALPHVMQAIAAATELGLVTLYEIDDLIFAPAYPGPLEAYSGGITVEDHIGLALAVPLFEEAMRFCRYGIASTPSLARAMKPIVQTGTVFVHPNALGRRHVDFIRLHEQLPKHGTTQRVTIFYGSGTKAHKEDFQLLIEPALVELVRRHGARIAIILMGHFPDSERLRSIGDNLTILEPTWDIESYWSVLAGADINIAPLQPTPMTDAKSEIKWLEAGMLGIPSVVSDTATYREVVRHRETGLICTDSAGWTAALDLLVSDPELRHTIGQNARSVALRSYGPTFMAERIGHLVQEVSPAPDPRPLIVVVNVFYPPQAIGGATRVVHDNIRDVAACAGDRYRFEVFTSIDGGDPYQVTTHTADGTRVTGVGSPHHPELEYRAIDDKMGEIFGAFLDRVQPAMVHFHCIQRLTASVVAATASRRIPYIVSVHDGWWISDHQFLIDEAGQIRTYDFAAPLTTLRDEGPRSYGRLIQLRRALLGANRVLAVSEPFAKLYAECGVTNVVACPNGVSNLRLVDRLASAGRVRLGFVGGLARHKGYDLIQIALKSTSYQNLSLLLIDHGMGPGEVRREIWGNVPVEFRAKWPQARVAELYAQIDILLAPSLWPESFGLVSREALISGCWVIASDRGSIGECVESGRNGFVIDVSSPDDLIATLQQIDRTPERYLHPPGVQIDIRRSTDQAAEIAAVYDTVLGTTASEGIVPLDGNFEDSVASRFVD